METVPVYGEAEQAPLLHVIVVVGGVVSGLEYGSLLDTAALQVAAVVGAMVSEAVMTSRAVSTVVPAGAPFGWPAAAIQSRNVLRSASSMEPAEEVQVA